MKSDLLGQHLKAFPGPRAPFAGLLALVFLLFVPHGETGRAQTQAQTSAAQPVWVASWTTSQQIPEPQNSLPPELPPPAPNQMPYVQQQNPNGTAKTPVQILEELERQQEHPAPPDSLRNATLRQIVHLSLGGSALRVHLSNAFGTAPLHFLSVHIARPIAPDGPAIDPATDRSLTFDGATDVIVPAGAEFVSDPVTEPVAPLSDLAISFYLADPPARETGHPGSRATSYLVSKGQTGEATFTNFSKVDHWYQLAAVDVLAPAGAATVVALGDSTTDGHGATTNGNDRWTDDLAARLAQAGRNVGVANAGIGGNHLLIDGLGPSALSRIDRDILAPAGVRWVIVFEGINDLGGLNLHGDAPPADHAALVARIVAAYEQIVVRAHAHGLRVYGATVTPDGGSGFYHPGPLNEADRQTVNAWIRAPGHFDAAIDFDAAVRDPQQPDRLLPAFDCGDHLHPSPAGYRAMANAIPLNLF